MAKNITPVKIVIIRRSSSIVDGILWIMIERKGTMNQSPHFPLSFCEVLYSGEEIPAKFFAELQNNDK